MTREFVRKLFPDATEDQITGILNQHHSDLAAEKASYESKLGKFNDAVSHEDELQSKIDELQAKIDEAEQGKLTEAEKQRKEFEKAQNRIAELEKTLAIKDQKTTIAEKFKLSSEQVNKVVKADGTLDYDIFGQIVEEKEAAAALAKEQELAAASMNPGGGAMPDERSIAEEKAKSIARKPTGVNQDILNNYRR